MKDALRLQLQKCKFHRFEAQLQPGKIASEEALTKTGFQKAGILRERHFYKEKYQTIVFIGLLKTGASIGSHFSRKSPLRK